ncbi:uncharacterized protein LOC143018369 [Oratosquilla oratoria]|uniref:uncharacterized protein LOC143018369 n=1 Tax=Oratosquilla oratoria TaxID=337810 RepID=UPI003F77794F
MVTCSTPSVSRLRQKPALPMSLKCNMPMMPPTLHITPQSLRRNLNTVNSIYSAGGLVVNASKTEVLPIQHNTAVPVPQFTIGGEDLKTVESFKYLGSILSATCDTENEIQTRIRLASSSFGKLSKRVFLNRDLTVQTKIKVYQAICLSILIFGTETWTLYKPQIRRLEGFHIRCLQTILNITWRDRIPHVSILQNASNISIKSMIVRRQLRWIGHVIRMPECRPSRRIGLLHGELRDGNRYPGGPKQRFKDQIKATLKLCNISVDQLETLATD